MDAVAESISNKLVPADVQNTMAAGRLAAYYFCKMIGQVIFTELFVASKNLPYPFNSLSVLVALAIVVIFGFHVWCNRDLDPKELLVSALLTPRAHAPTLNRLPCPGFKNSRFLICRVGQRQGVAGVLRQ